MYFRFKKIIFTIVTIAILMPFSTTFADLKNETFNINEYLITDGQAAHEGDLTKFVIRIINLFLEIVAAIMIGIVVIAGLRLITAAGGENAIQKGKDILINAIIGFLIILAALSITLFVQYTLYSEPEETSKEEGVSMTSFSKIA